MITSWVVQPHKLLYNTIYMYQVIQAVTFLSPSWRSLNPWKGHLMIPKRSRRIARYIYYIYIFILYIYYPFRAGSLYLQTNLKRKQMGGSTDDVFVVISKFCSLGSADGSDKGLLPLLMLESLFQRKCISFDILLKHLVLERQNDLVIWCKFRL